MLAVTRALAQALPTASTANGWLNTAAQALPLIENHYGRYVRSDAAEQLAKMLGSVTPTQENGKRWRGKD
jgi:hypothetical protein